MAEATLCRPPLAFSKVKCESDEKPLTGQVGACQTPFTSRLTADVLSGCQGEENYAPSKLGWAGLERLRMLELRVQSHEVFSEECEESEGAFTW